MVRNVFTLKKKKRLQLSYRLKLIISIYNYKNK